MDIYLGQIYPLWLCPVVIPDVPSMIPKGRADEKYIDIGIYGLTPKVKEYDLEKTTKKFEQFALENHG
jgi:delta24-sterol reductase